MSKSSATVESKEPEEDTVEALQTKSTNYSECIQQDRLPLLSEISDGEITSGVKHVKNNEASKNVLKSVGRNPKQETGINATISCISEKLSHQTLQDQQNSKFIVEAGSSEKQNELLEFSISHQKEIVKNNKFDYEDYEWEEEENYFAEEDYIGDALDADCDQFELRDVRVKRKGTKQPKIINAIVKDSLMATLLLESSSKENYRGFDMKPSYAIFNKMETYSRISKKKMQNSSKNVVPSKSKIDKFTRLILKELVKANTMKNINGIMCRGSEALILHADRNVSMDPNYGYHRECIIKVFRTNNGSKQFDHYIKDDYRFKDRFLKPNSRVDGSMWAEKEKLNIERLNEHKIPCPTVFSWKKNVLVMSFMGNNRRAYPKLKHAKLSDYYLKRAYEQIIGNMRDMYRKANLVHADLSEHNILWDQWNCWLIDFTRSVDSSHPLALDYLMRDCDRISSFFERLGGLKVKTKEQLFQFITSYNPEDVFNRKRAGNDNIPKLKMLTKN